MEATCGLFKEPYVVTLVGHCTRPDAYQSQQRAVADSAEVTAALKASNYLTKWVD